MRISSSGWRCRNKQIKKNTPTTATNYEQAAEDGEICLFSAKIAATSGTTADGWCLTSSSSFKYVHMYV